MSSVRPFSMLVRHIVRRVGVPLRTLVHSLDWADAVMLTIIALVISAYVYHRFYYYVPNTDFFALLNEGSWLIRHPFAWVKYPPVYGAILAVLEYTLPLRRAAQEGGVLINIGCLSVSAVLLWRLLKPVGGAWSILPVTAWLVHPLTATVTLEPLNFSLFLMLVLFGVALHKRYPSLAYAVAVLAFYTRYEGIVLLLVYAATDLLTRKRIRNAGHFALAVLALVPWAARSVMLGNQYAQEMAARRLEIPNTQIIPYYAVTLPAFLEFTSRKMVAAFFLYAGVGLALTITVFRDALARLVAFGVLYFLTHIFFPEGALRYAHPLLPSLIVVYAWPVFIVPRAGWKIRAVTLLAAALFVAYSGSRFFTPSIEYEVERVANAELRVAAEWLNAHASRRAVVYAYQSWVYAYYTDNPNITYSYYNTMEKFKASVQREDIDTYVMLQDRYDINNGYLDVENGITLYQTLLSAPDTYHLLPVHTATFGFRSVTVYKAEPSK